MSLSLLTEIARRGISIRIRPDLVDGKLESVSLLFSEPQPEREDLQYGLRLSVETNHFSKQMEQCLRSALAQFDAKLPLPTWTPTSWRSTWEPTLAPPGPTGTAWEVARCMQAVPNAAAPTRPSTTSAPSDSAKSPSSSPADNAETAAGGSGSPATLN